MTIAVTQFTAIFTVGEGRVLIDPATSGVTVSAGNSTDTVTFSGTKDQINSLLDGTFGTITYLNDQTVASDTPSASTTITLTVNDQGNTGSDPGDSGDASSEEDAASQTINITSVNDAPTFLGPELISNGDFGNSDLAGTGWTTTGAAVVQSDQLNFGGSNATTENTLSQTINTVDGETYTLSFNYRDRSGGTNTLNQSLVVSVDGIGNLLTTEAILTDTDDQIYVRYTFTFTADSATSTIKFTDTSADPDSMSSGSESNDGRLDNISVKQTDGNLSSVTYVEDSTPVVLDADLLLFDAEISAGLDDYSGTTLVLQRNGGQNSDDVFSATGNLVFDGSQVKFPISGTEQVIGTLANSDGTLSIQFTNASLTEADINEILQSITYSNTNQAPPSSVQIDWTFNDSNEAAESDPQGTGGSLTATGSTTVNITAVNDAPVISGGPDSVDLTETNVGLTSTGDLTVTDVDTTDNVTASVESVVVTGTGSSSVPIALTNTAIRDFLTVTPTAILDGSENSATLTWNFNSDSEAFDFLAKDETLVLTYTVSATDDDGTPLSDTETVTVTITGTNDGPDVTGPATATVAENGSLTFNTAGAGLIDTFDVDGDDLTVTLTANHASIALAQTTGLTLIDNDGSDGTLQFSGTQANIDAALDGLDYDSQAGFNGSATLVALVDDGNLTDSTTVAITVTPGQTTFVWDGGGTTNNWSDAANWDLDLVPGADDIVIFDVTSSKDATVDAAFAGAVSQVNVTADYTGELKLFRDLNVSGTATLLGNGALNLSGNTLDVDGDFTSSMNLEIASSTLNLGGDVDVTASSTNVSGSQIVLDGTGDQSVDINPRIGSIEFASAGTVTIADTLRIFQNVTYTSGTVDFNDQTLLLDGNFAHTIDVEGIAFDSVTINAEGAIDVVGDFDIDGDLTLTKVGSITNGSLDDGRLLVSGDIHASDDAYTGDAVLLIDGSGDQTITTDSSNDMLRNVDIAKTGGTLTFDDDITFQGAFTHTSGTVDIDSVSTRFTGSDLALDTAGVTFGNVEFASDANFTLSSDIDIDGNLLISGLTGTNSDGDLFVTGNVVSTDSDVAGDFNIVLNGTGTQTISGADLTDGIRDNRQGVGRGVVAR